MAEIFISYAREDRSRIEPLAVCLERRGWTVFWDRKIQAGQQWHDVITGALDRAERVIVAWSNDSLRSDFVRDEAASAQERKILVPILLDAVTPPLGFRQIQAADFTNWSGEEDAPAMEQLLRDLGAPSPTHDSSLPTATVSAPPRTTDNGSVSKRRRLPVLAAAMVTGGLLVATLVAVLTPSTRNKAGRPAPPTPTVSSTGPKQVPSVPAGDLVVKPPVLSPFAVERSQMLETLRAYYRDMNASTFDAERYFAPRVSLYIGMRNPSRMALNRYIRNDFPRQYTDYRVELLEDTIVREGPRVFAFREISRFTDVSKNRRREMTAANRVTLDESGKIIRFEQTHISG